MRLKNLSIRTGLLTLLAVITLLLLLVSGMGIQAINKSRDSLTQLNQIQGEQLGALMNGYNLTLRARASATLAVRKIEIGLLDVGAKETDKLDSYIQQSDKEIRQFSSVGTTSEQEQKTGTASVKNLSGLPESGIKTDVRVPEKAVHRRILHLAGK
ncbi:hypothetical protein OS12_39570 [Dickeya oryzae]